MACNTNLVADLCRPLPAKAACIGDHNLSLWPLPSVAENKIAYRPIATSLDGRYPKRCGKPAQAITRSIGNHRRERQHALASGCRRFGRIS